MKRTATPRNTKSAEIQVHKAARFVQARDSRKRKIAGLWIRNGRFYAALWVTGGTGKGTSRRFPIEATNITEAKEKLEILRNDRREEKLPTAGRKPMLAEYIETYLASPARTQRRESTQKNDRESLARWLAEIGDAPIHKITPSHVLKFQDSRSKGGAKPRTVNLDMIALRGLLKRALAEGHLRELPKLQDMKRGPVPKRRLLTPAEFERVIAAAREHCPRNGVQFIDYLRFLAYSGAREQEALRMTWGDVDLDARRIVIGSDGLAKNHEARTVELNATLVDLLREMATRRAPDSEWMFPSPHRGKCDVRTMTFRNSLRLVRVKADLKWFGFHDLRHYFASMCVMNGLDFMTTAAWLGHKDGGMLVGKVYGHLLDEHRHQSASRLHFGITSLPGSQTAGQA